MFKNSRGAEIKGTLRRATPFCILFEIYASEDAPALSDVFPDCQVFLGNRLAYSGRAVVRNVVDLGTGFLCEARLDEPLEKTQGSLAQKPNVSIAQDFGKFLHATENMFKVAPAFKLAVADMRTFLLDLQRWTDQIALSDMRGLSEAERARFEQQVIQAVQEPLLSFFGPMFSKFEEACLGVASEADPLYAAYAQRHLHPLVLCAPFMRRTFEKPLGHAGDFEMVNMMMRDPAEGATLFAKVLNTFFLSTPPVVAHRNRVAYLKEIIEQETCRVIRQDRRIQILNLGCGPAKEVEDFLRDSPLSDRADFTLVDFSEDALKSTGKVLNRLKALLGRNCSIDLIRKSVAQLLKEELRKPAVGDGKYDLVYCAGLFDYLPDSVCARLVESLYGMLAGDGLLLVTNVERSNPSRRWMEYAVDWHLAYRNTAGMLAMVPAGRSEDGVRVETELTGVNIFLKVRKLANE